MHSKTIKMAINIGMLIIYTGDIFHTENVYLGTSKDIS